MGRTGDMAGLAVLRGQALHTNDKYVRPCQTCQPTYQTNEKPCQTCQNSLDDSGGDIWEAEAGTPASHPSHSVTIVGLRLRPAAANVISI